jgi:hypothetical protein
MREREATGGERNMGTEVHHEAMIHADLTERLHLVDR